MQRIEESDLAVDSKDAEIDALIQRIRKDGRMANNDEREAFAQLDAELRILAENHSALLSLLLNIVSQVGERAEIARQSLLYLIPPALEATRQNL